MKTSQIFNVVSNLSLHVLYFLPFTLPRVWCRAACYLWSVIRFDLHNVWWSCAAEDDELHNQSNPRIHQQPTDKQKVMYCSDIDQLLINPCSNDTIEDAHVVYRLDTCICHLLLPTANCESHHVIEHGWSVLRRWLIKSMIMIDLLASLPRLQSRMNLDVLVRLPAYFGSSPSLRDKLAPRISTVWCV